MSPIQPIGSRGPSAKRRRRTLRLRTLLIWLAVVPIVALGVQSALAANRLLEQSGHLRADVESGERLGVPLYRLMVAMQSERTLTAARWAGTTVPEDVMGERRAATDEAATGFRRSWAPGSAVSELADRRLQEVSQGLDDLNSYRERTDSGIGSADSTLVYYSGVIGQMIRFYQDELSHTEDGGLIEDTRVVTAMFAASEMVAQEDMILAQAGPSRTLTTSRFADFVNAVGAQRYLYDTWIVPYLPDAQNDLYAQMVRSGAWQTKTRIESAVLSEQSITDDGVKLPRDVKGWSAAQEQWGPQLSTLNADRSRALLARADARATDLETDVAWLIAGSAAALLAVATVVALTTRSVLRRLSRLHDRTVTVAERTLPDVVDRLQSGRPVDPDALPAVRGEQDEVGRISDAFARVVAVSVSGHRQLAAERMGFGMFAAGIASRTGNLVSRQLSLTEELQDTFGHDETLLAELMRADQLTVGMRRQTENLLILAGGEIPDPHTEPMRIADLLREAAAEVEDFRRIERQALDEISVEASVISQVSHLLAELLDNATRFSPPRSKVVIRAELVADGLSVEIEDRGPKVAPATYEEMNGRLHSAPPYAVLAENAHRLGLFVVGHLADGLGATVVLRRSVYGGTSAVVILPKALLVPTKGETGGAPPVASVHLESARAEPSRGGPAREEPELPARSSPADGESPRVEPAREAPVRFETEHLERAPVVPEHVERVPVVPKPVVPAPMVPKHVDSAPVEPERADTAPLGSGVPAPRGPGDDMPETGPHTGAGLPVRRAQQRSNVRSHEKATHDEPSRDDSSRDHASRDRASLGQSSRDRASHERPSHQQPLEASARPARPAEPVRDRRPALPERVPQTHMAEQLLGPRRPTEAAAVGDQDTPEEVADAWADYEQGTQMVEEELRQDRR
ncbi:sensor histidine kinase [Streptomyces sp. WMMC940]|uniref:sensor histidine kinase n=1 Tax=Streptomyces sp. WMMC940 TaxID=3015153 RepID=UPI0022B6864B|nr:nitrate- and nitrite sensing domain-containing protein [Streptomyces sp. WMMC940]MCZ7456885.1 nitrate- and nitrite sensing domain-containing protein [Streptomyces sp. WMMC940]